MSEQRFLVNSEDELAAVAQQVLAAWPEKRIFLFFGDLGAGKTTFIKRFCQALNVADTVQSPTFAIVNVYVTEGGEEVYHLDLYRMETPQEALDVGLVEYLESGNYCFVEWPERAGFVPEGAVAVYLKSTGEHSREIVVREAAATV